MKTATVATVVTVRKVNLKVMMRKVLTSLTEKASFNKSPRNHVIIVKIGICPLLRWLSVPDAFGTYDNNSICPICDYKIPVDNEQIKEAFAHCKDCGATCHKNMKTSKVSFYFPTEDKD